MKKILFSLTILFILMACESRINPPQKQPEAPSLPKVVIEKEREEKEEPLGPEVKIRLKRDGKDNYMWEISGSDADQILKVNDKLRRKLVQQSP